MNLISIKYHKIVDFESLFLCVFVKIPEKANREDIHPGVELGLTGPTSISTNIRTTCSKSLAVFVSNDSSLSVRPRILFVVELAIAEMACVSSNVRRTFHVPSGVRVQRSISERDVSHPCIS